MANIYDAPEITVQEVAEKLNSQNSFVLLDVREPRELEYARIDHPAVELAPLSLLSMEQTDALPEAALNKETEIVVVCHHGVRSAEVTAWLRKHGWQNVYSMEGGLAAFASEIDPSIGQY